MGGPGEREPLGEHGATGRDHLPVVEPARPGFDLPQRFVQLPRRAVRTVGDHRLDDVGHGQDPRLEADRVAGEPARVP